MYLLLFSTPTHLRDIGGRTRSIPEPGKEERIMNPKSLEWDQALLLVPFYSGSQGELKA